MKNVIKAKDLKPITNGEKLIEIFPNADLNSICGIEFLSQPYKQPHREYALKNNPIFESEVES